MTWTWLGHGIAHLAASNIFKSPKTSPHIAPLVCQALYGRPGSDHGPSLSVPALCCLLVCPAVLGQLVQPTKQCHKCHQIDLWAYSNHSRIHSWHMEHQQTPTRPQHLPWVLQLHLLGRCSHSSWHPLQPWVAGSPLAASLRLKRWAACPARNCGTQGPDGIFGDRMSQGSPSLLLQQMFYDSILSASLKFFIFRNSS